MENKNLRLGDYIVAEGGKKVQIEGIAEGKISCGLLSSFTLKDAASPALTKDFFINNGFAPIVDEGAKSYFLGNENTSISARVCGTHFFLRVRNRVYSFAGPCDDLNEFLHILDDCAIKRNFNCE